MAPQIGERAPIELRFRHFEENALRIGQGQIVYDEFSQQRSLDIADPDLHAVFEFYRFDLIGNQPAAKIRVNHDNRQQQDRYDHSQSDQRPFGKAPLAFRQGFLAQVPSFSRIVDFVFAGHQKACPMET